MSTEAPSTEFGQRMARITVGAYDGVQDVRTSMMNRVRDVIRKKNEDIPFDHVEEEKDEDERDFESKYDDENLPTLLDEMLEEERLTEDEYGYLQTMLNTAELAEQMEDRYSQVMEITESEPVYEEWLQHVYGVSSTLTARLLNTFGYCEDYDRVSNLWSYSGLAPGQSRERGEQLNYNPDAKTLAWLVADNMIKQGSRSEYRVHFYDPYKEKQISRWERDKDGLCIKCGEREQVDTFLVEQWSCTECNNTGYGETSAERHMEVMEKQGRDGHTVSFGVDPEERDVSLCAMCAEQIVQNGEHFPSAPNSRGHADNRARRYLGKKFLKHYWAIARNQKCLDVPQEWIIAHGGHEEKTESFENPFYAKRQIQSPD